jgi:hypothetical protein
MPAGLAQQKDENRHQSGARECDPVTCRASSGQPHLLNQQAPVTGVTCARSTFA